MATYTKEGFIYVNAGCRGRDVGAPAGITDLKAAVRYIRYNEGNLPGSMDHIFTFGMSGGNGERPGREKLNGNLPDKENLPDGERPNKDGFPDDEIDGDFPDGEMDEDFKDNINRTEASGGVTLSGTYETVQDYINALNADTKWVTYDKKTNTATITSIADFVTACKSASKNVGAFDDLNETQGENELFGYGDGNGAHFDSVMADILADNKDYGQAYN